MGTRTLVVAGLSLLVVGTGCQPAAQEGAALSEADVAAIEALHAAFLEAERANEWEGVAALMTEDAVIMPMGHPVLDGRAGYLDFVGSLVEEHGAVVTSFNGTIAEIDGRGDVAYMRGTWSHTLTMGGIPGEISEAGKQLVILRKQPDGSWLASRWIWNSDGP